MSCSFCYYVDDINYLSFLNKFIIRTIFVLIIYRFCFPSVVRFDSKHSHIFYSALPQLLFFLFSNLKIFFRKKRKIFCAFLLSVKKHKNRKTFLQSDSVQILHTAFTCHHTWSLFFLFCSFALFPTKTWKTLVVFFNFFPMHFVTLLSLDLVKLSTHLLIFNFSGLFFF